MDTHELEIGSFIGPYEILRVLGQGCMGIVYLGRHRVLEVEHALKLLPVDFSRDPQRIQRFLKEARQTAKLWHPNIVHVVGADMYDGRYYIAMEFIDGLTLEALLRQSALDTYQAARYTFQIALALSHAHAHGVIHRDVKPENVMVDHHNQAKLTDFGLAREAPSLQNENATHLTNAGVILGTPYYMSPEQWACEEIDQRTDIYALGVFFYYLLTEQHPYPGQSVAQILYRQMRGAVVPLRTHLPLIDPDIERIVSRAIHTDPAQRFQCAQEMADAIYTWWKKSPPFYELDLFPPAAPGAFTRTSTQPRLRSTPSQAANPNIKTSPLKPNIQRIHTPAQTPPVLSPHDRTPPSPSPPVSARADQKIEKVNPKADLIADAKISPCEPARSPFPSLWDALHQSPSQQVTLLRTLLGWLRAIEPSSNIRLWALKATSKTLGSLMTVRGRVLIGVKAFGEPFVDEQCLRDWDQLSPALIETIQHCLTQKIPLHLHPRFKDAQTTSPYDQHFFRELCARALMSLVLISEDKHLQEVRASEDIASSALTFSAASIYTAAARLLIAGDTWDTAAHVAENLLTFGAQVWVFTKIAGNFFPIQGLPSDSLDLLASLSDIVADLASQPLLHPHTDAPLIATFSSDDACWVYVRAHAFTTLAKVRHAHQGFAWAKFLGALRSLHAPKRDSQPALRLASKD